MYRCLLGSAVPLVMLGRLLSGQVSSGSIDVGTAILSQPTIGSSNVLTAAGAYSTFGARGALSANGVAARTPNDLYTGQGVLTGARYAAPEQPLRWELGATASGFGVSGAAPSFGWSGLAREHLDGSKGGGFAGITAGAIGQSGDWRRILGAHVGGYLRFEAANVDELSAALAYTDAGAPDSLGAVRYADLFGYWQHRQGRFELLAGAGARARSSWSGASGWASGSATVWLTSRLAVVVAAGRALEDVPRAVPSVRYISIALRAGQRLPADMPLVLAPHIKIERSEGHLEVRAAADSMRIVSVVADSASSVELMADFTGWESVPMTREHNGTWTLERPITSGVHHVVIRIDEGAWRPPSNLASVPDEFGGEVGLLAVP